MGGKPVSVGKNIHRFRMRLMNKLLSKPTDDTSTADLVSDDVYRNILLTTARANTDAYHAVFPEFPHSSYVSLQQYDDVR